jgi:cytochrome c-type biogenesis protein CcmE
MELTPRTTGDATSTGRPRRRRRWLPLLTVLVVFAAIGVLAVKGLSDATVYFRNADEAVAQRDELGTRRFRLQGTVTGEPTREVGQVHFDVAYNGVSVAVRHTGDPPELFRPGIPVVLEGHWADVGEVDLFESDRILVKHDETYESQEDYDDRMRQMEQDRRDQRSAASGR